MKLTFAPRRQSRATSQDKRSWARIIGATGAALAVGASTFALTMPANALDTAKTGPLLNGFPAFYTDNTGLSTATCTDGSANCGGATLASDGAGGPGITVAPDGEGFYWMATATVNSPRGSIDVEFAHEGAWVAVGQPTVFDRTRIRGDLTPGKYTLLTPYGQIRVSAVGTGQRNVNQTNDATCALPAGACGAKMTNWLVSTSAPAGYLGDSVSATTVTGSPLRNELVLLNSKGAVVGSTKRFIVMGKLVDGGAAILSSPTVDFGNTAKVAHRALGLKNQGNAPLTLQGITVAGSKNIKVDPTGCAAKATLASGASCAVNLTYTPGKLKVSKATLVINDSSTAGVHRVPVAAMTSSEFSAPKAVKFNATKVGASSKTRRVVVTNTGVQPLKVKGISVKGSGARSFERRTGQAPVCAKGSVVRPHASCAMYVAFAPKSFGAKTANLTVRTNAASSPNVVRLAGRGR